MTATWLVGVVLDIDLTYLMLLVLNATNDLLETTFSA